MRTQIAQAHGRLACPQGYGPAGGDPGGPGIVADDGYPSIVSGESGSDADVERQMTRLLEGLRSVTFEGIRQVGEHELARLRAEPPDLESLDPMEAAYEEWLRSQSVESILTGALQHSADHAEFLAAVIASAAPFDVSESAWERMLAEAQQVGARVFGSGEFAEYLRVSASGDPAAVVAWETAHPGVLLRDYQIARAFIVFVVAYGVFLIDGGDGFRDALMAAVAAVLFFYDDEVKRLLPRIIGDKPDDNAASQ